MQELTGGARRAPRETKEEKKARELNEAYGNTYENHDEDALKTKVVDLLNNIDDTVEQQKAQSDAMKDRVDDYKDELLYVRQRIDYVRSAQGRSELADQATELINAAS
jgi:hypothetical protein